MKVIKASRPSWPASARCDTCRTDVELDFDDLTPAYSNRVTWRCPVCGSLTYASADLVRRHSAEQGIREKSTAESVRDDPFVEPAVETAPERRRRRRFRSGGDF